MSAEKQEEEYTRLRAVAEEARTMLKYVGHLPENCQEKKMWLTRVMQASTAVDEHYAKYIARSNSQTAASSTAANTVPRVSQRRRILNELINDALQAKCKVIQWGTTMPHTCTAFKELYAEYLRLEKRVNDFRAANWRKSVQPAASTRESTTDTIRPKPAKVQQQVPAKNSNNSNISPEQKKSIVTATSAQKNGERVSSKQGERGRKVAQREQAIRSALGPIG